MKKIILAILLPLAVAASCARYEKVASDPLKTRIYTLDNGLKVYMSVNKDEPRIQTYIAVRVGGKNDPADNTGLAHYLEHLMFKGTEQFGTSDYAAEKPLLDSIQVLYDVYRTLKDPKEREAAYHVIDSISYEASKIAIANEYDKMMSEIGAIGTNAFTSEDVTCYTENIPSNQIENWARIQADRFKNMVIRGFHTELEAVYEEYNRGLTSDIRTVLDTVNAALYPHHPYGTQTVIGTQEHLKNPDITAIKRQKATYYVPNNCAICLSGDFDPEKAIKIIRRYFSDWEATDGVPQLQFEAESPLTEPIRKEVKGTEAEFVMTGWRVPGTGSREGEIAELVAEVLCNGRAGLIDLNLNQQQQVLGGHAFLNSNTDYSQILLLAFPKQGQTLEQAEELLLGEMQKLRSGDFDGELLQACINNLRLRKMENAERNSSRAMLFVESFVNGTSWKDEVGKLDRLAGLTREDIVSWAGKYLGAENFVTVYKRTGINPAFKKIEAPKITPIETNRDKKSLFLEEIQTNVPEPIEPVFTDFSKDMSVIEDNGRTILYKRNETNSIATVCYYWETGREDIPALEAAMTYIEYLGTPGLSAEQMSKQMYASACSVSYTAGANSSSIVIRGLDENIPAAMDMVEDLLRNAIGDEQILASLKADLIKNRQDAKLSQAACAGALRTYMMYGPEYIKNRTLDNASLVGLSSEDLLVSIKDLLGKEHRILYYGPSSEKDFIKMLGEHHEAVADAGKVVKKHNSKLLTDEAAVLLVQYDSKQLNYSQFSNRGETYDPTLDARAALFNEYFGGGMNSIVFQEMRESRALAYSAGAMFMEPSFAEDSYSFIAMIGTQNDKHVKAVTAFDEIINGLPCEENNLQIAKNSILTRLRTSRTMGMNVLMEYIACQELGLDEPKKRRIFEEIQELGMEDLLEFHEKMIKDRRYIYGLLGDKADLDKSFLRSLGPVKELSLEDIFGY